jgi:hypothetical protein
MAGDTFVTTQKVSSRELCAIPTGEGFLICIFEDGKGKLTRSWSEAYEEIARTTSRMTLQML